MQYIENILSICKNIYDQSSATNKEKEMLKEYPHMFVFGCLMDSQINSDKAWEIPYLIVCMKEIPYNGFINFHNEFINVYKCLYYAK